MQSFNELELSSPLKRAIAELGFEKPSQIQAEALPILLGEPTDFLGLAATGTGKTAAFSIPLLERVDPAQRGVQGLVLCPTRELAIQVAGQIELLGKYKNIRAVAVYGGSSFMDQVKGLKQGASIVVGTPGRVFDHLERGTLTLDQLSTAILDEADEMISMGFKEQIELILENAPKEQSNIWLFSATMSREVRKVADEYLRNPQQVQINRTEMLPDTIEQLYYITHESNKPEILCKLIDAADDFYGLIFCQTKSLVTDLTQFLNDRGYRVDCLHGDKDQNQRERTMQAYRDRKVNVLICTDVASRGIDVKDVTHVINYSIPRELDSYVHRIGRTARSGKTGFAMSLVTPSHRNLIPRIEKMTKSRMKEGKIPTRKEIGMKKVSKILAAFQEQKTFSRAVELLDQSWKDAVAQMTPEEIVGRFLCLTYPETFVEREKGEAPKAPLARPQASGKAPMIVRPERDQSERRGGRDEFRGGREEFRDSFRRDQKPRFGDRQRDDRREEGRYGEWRSAKDRFSKRAEKRSHDDVRPSDARRAESPSDFASEGRAAKSPWKIKGGIDSKPSKGFDRDSRREDRPRRYGDGKKGPKWSSSWDQL